MKPHRRQTRDYLKSATRTDFWEVVREAKITDDDQEILDYRFVRGKSIGQIALLCHCSEEKVKEVIKNSYDKISKLVL